MTGIVAPADVFVPELSKDFFSTVTILPFERKTKKLKRGMTQPLSYYKSTYGPVKYYS